MESLVNYESDDGNLKNANKSSSKELNRNKEKRRYSSDDDSSDSSDSPHERSRKKNNEDDNKPAARRHSPSPRKSSHKSSRNDKNKSHDSRSDRYRKRSSSRDSDKYERKKRKDRDDDRDDKKRHRRRSTDHQKRSGSRDREDHSKSRHRDRSNERRKDRHDDHKRNNRHEGDRRFDEKRDRERGRDRERDYRRDEPAHRNNNSRNTNDGRSSSSSSSSSAIRRAEALNRTIERRANEKVQQLQKLGIEIPALMLPQLRHVQEQQGAQIKPLMSLNIGATSGGLPFNPTVTIPTATTTAAAAAATTDETKAEQDNLTLNLSNFTSSVLTNAKYTEQMQKKKLIWGAKKVPEAEASTTNNKWEAAKFSQDSDGKMASKFLRLMGMKNAPVTATAVAPAADTEDPSVQKREQMFSTMEQQYEIARQATHTMRGMGLGFGSHRPC